MGRDLIAKVNNAGTFTDVTLDAREYLRDPIQNTLAPTDFFYLGLYKPFSDLYAEQQTPLTAATLLLEYYDGTTWQALDFSDQTKSWTRSGFIHWQRPDDWQQTTVDSQQAFWIRASFTAPQSIDLMGINLVFASDIDLEKHQRDINLFKAKGDASFIAYHVSARDEIIQTIRNGGTRTKKSFGKAYQDFTQWDVLDLGQIREAATHLALSKIHFDISQDVDDKNFQRHKKHFDFFGKAFDLFQRSFDLDDDGEVDVETEKNTIRNTEILKS